MSSRSKELILMFNTLLISLVCRLLRSPFVRGPSNFEISEASLVGRRRLGQFHIDINKNLYCDFWSRVVAETKQKNSTTPFVYEQEIKKII
jgi:hypothetical protein